MMDSFKQPFTRIKEGYSQKRQLPRLGKIRLGLKVEQKARNGNGTVQFPRETEHFVVPPEVAEVYGEQPVELDVMLPHEDPEVIFVQKLARYGSGAGLKCHGNGQEALELNEQTREWVSRSCPCEKRKTDKNPKGDCDEQSSLMVLLPRVSMGGCYQITTRSFHSTVTLNSALDYIRALAGRIALIPLKLRREPRETHHDGKKQTHYTLNLILDADYKEVRQLRNDTEATMIPARYLIEGPTDENPELDPPDIHEVEAEDLANMSKAQVEDVRSKLKQSQAAKAEEPKKAEPKPEPAKAAEPAQTAEEPTLFTADESKWKDMIVYMNEDPDRAKLLKQVKDRFAVTSVAKLAPALREGFINTLKDDAAKLKMKLDL